MGTFEMQICRDLAVHDGQSGLALARSRDFGEDDEIGRAYLGTRPSQKSVQRLCRQISERTDRRTLLLDPEQQVARLNRMMVGWANYFHLGPVSKAYRSVDRHAVGRLRQWLRHKHKVQDRGMARFPTRYLRQKLGLVCLASRTRDLPWANA